MTYRPSPFSVASSFDRLRTTLSNVEGSVSSVVDVIPMVVCSRRLKTYLSLIAVTACLAVTLWLSTRPVLAHHSFGAEYDANAPITLSGVITKIEWTNPHSHFFLDVTDDKGTVTNWKFEGYPPNALYRTGWKKDVTMKPGDRITVFGWRARDGTNWAHSREITFTDGTKLFFGPPSGTGDGGETPPVKVP